MINNLIIPVNSLSAYTVQIRLLTVNFDKRRNFSLQQGTFLVIQKAWVLDAPFVEVCNVASNVFYRN